MIHSLEEICLEVTNKCYARCLHCSSKAGSPLPYELELSKIESLIDDAATLSRYHPPIGTKGVPAEELLAVLPRLQNSVMKNDNGDTETWKAVVENELSNFRNTNRKKPVLELSGGEPLLRDDIHAIVKYAKSKGFEIVLYTSIITEESGEGISDDGIKQWSDILDENDRMIISIEGASEESHDEMTQVKGHFKISMDALDRFQRAGITVNAHCTPTKINFKEIPKLVRLLEGRVREIAFLRLVPQGRALTNIKRLRLSKQEFMELQEIIYAEWRRAESTTITVRWGCPIDFRHLLYSVDRKPCHGGRDQIVIRPNGDVHPCPAWKEIGTMNLGNILHTSLRHIWLESEILNMFREFVPENLQGECTWCPSKRICGGGCPAQRILANVGRGIKDRRALLAVGPDPDCFKELL